MKHTSHIFLLPNLIKRVSFNNSFVIPTYQQSLSSPLFITTLADVPSGILGLRKTQLNSKLFVQIA